jgi:integrase
LWLLTYCGSRKMEILAAEWTEFDLDAGGWIKPAEHTKQGTVHATPLPVAVKERLIGIQRAQRASRKLKDCRYVIPSPLYGPTKHMVGASANYALNRICKKAGISPKIRVHDLRHNFATEHVNNGTDLYVVGKLLGHRRPQTTQRYAHLNTETLRKAADTIAEKMMELEKAPADIVQLPISNRKG